MTALSLLFALASVSSAQVTSAKSPLQINGSTVSHVGTDGNQHTPRSYGTTDGWQLTTHGGSGDAFWAPAGGLAVDSTRAAHIADSAKTAPRPDSARVAGLSDSTKALVRYARTTAIHDTADTLRQRITDSTGTLRTLIAGKEPAITAGTSSQVYLGPKAWGQVADAQVASGAAIAWSKISKSGAVAADVGAASASDLAGYLPLAGGTMTGLFTGASINATSLYSAGTVISDGLLTANAGINIGSGAALQINGTDAITSTRAGNLTALTVGSSFLIRNDPTWPTLVTNVYGAGVAAPGSTNYALSIDKAGDATYINGATGSSLAVGGEFKLEASSTGVAVTGALSVSGLSAGGIVKAAPTTGLQSIASAGTDYVVPSALGSYLPLIGGTLTGALGGTSAAFSGTIQFTADSSGILGVTNGLPPRPGLVGEFVSHTTLTTAPVALTSGAISKIDSLTLPAGSWLVAGSARFGISINTIPSMWGVSVSTITAYIPADQSGSTLSFPTATYAGEQTVIISPYVVNISTATKIYLMEYASWTSGTGVNGFGSITATRIR